MDKLVTHVASKHMEKKAKAWVLTVPKTTEWKIYLKEIETVKDGTQEMRYKTRYFPKEMKVGDKCYVVHDGFVQGWMKITKMLDMPEGFTCTTTGNYWEPGKYIVRSGPFHHESGTPMTGFRGIREYT